MAQPPPESDSNPYTTLPLTGPHPIGVGHALITLVEPHLHHERAYNRWYEDDHMFSGALYLPWLFSGRRWVATHALQQLRFPRPNALFAPVTKGCYLSTYWITPGRISEHKEWSFSVYNRLVAEGRVNDHREHVFTSFQDKAGTVYRDDFVPKDVFTLLDPSPGLVMEIIDAHAPDSATLREWILTSYLPSRITNAPESPVASAMVFQTRPPEPITPEVAARIGNIAGATNDPKRVTVLWFLTREPQEVWEFFTGEVERVSAGGLGEVAFCAPFIPAKMGTNAYDDILRAPAC